MDRNQITYGGSGVGSVALRKESVDRNTNPGSTTLTFPVALRKESVDRNLPTWTLTTHKIVALRKESVDRNSIGAASLMVPTTSLSARRAWIEILLVYLALIRYLVALRKESVDRNH